MHYRRSYPSNPLDIRTMEVLKRVVSEEATNKKWAEPYRELLISLWYQSLNWIPLNEVSKYSSATPDQIKHILARYPSLDLPRIQHPRVILVSLHALKLKWPKKNESE